MSLSMKAKLVSVFLVFSCVLITINGQTERKFDTKKQHTNHYGQMNSEFELPSPIYQFAEKDISWTLDNNDKITRIYSSAQIDQPFDFQCNPSNTQCFGLTINKVNIETIGQYLRKSESNDSRTNTITTYNLHGFDPIIVTCSAVSESETCIYNSTTNTIHVKENVEVIITCRTNVYNATDMDTAVVMEQHFQESNECLQNDLTHMNDQLTSITPGNERVVKSECSKRFKRGDENLACAFRFSANDQLDRMYRPDIDRLTINLDIKYWPTLNESALSSMDLNVSVPQGTTKSLFCPYEGNPIEYTWKKIEGEEPLVVGKEQVFQIPKSYQVGLHTIECGARMPGDTKSLTRPIKFSVNVVVNHEAQKKKKLFIIGASVVGGVVLLALIIIGIVVVARKGKSSNNVSRPRKGLSSDRAETSPLN